MIPDKIKLEIYTPDRKVFSEEIDSVRLPGADGYFGVFPGHTPYISVLGIGEIKVETAGESRSFATTGGLAEVLPSGIAVLAESCEVASDIDVERAQSAEERARTRLQEGRKTWDVQRAHVALAKAINRMKIASL